MTTPDPATTSQAVKSRFPWLKALLIASLAVNLLFVGGAAARYFTHDQPDRVGGYSQMQLVPRRFFGELERPRRTELLSVFKDFRSRFHEGRRRAGEKMASLAEALEADPYDPAAVKAIVDDFSRISADLIGEGSDAALVFIGKLTPQERQLLAKHIRQRGEDRHHGGRDRQNRDE